MSIKKWLFELKNITNQCKIGIINRLHYVLSNKTL